VAARLTITDRPTTTRRPADRRVAVTTTDGTAWTWHDLVREFGPAIAGYASSRGIRQPDDVVQDVLVTAVRKLDDFQGDRDALRSWLFVLAHRRIADRHRRFHRSPLVLVADHEPTPADQGDVDTGLLRSEAVSDAMAAFDILSDRQRAVLQMRIIDERSPAAVADELGLSQANVRVIQCRALARIRRHLENRTKTGDRTAVGIMWLVGGPRLITAVRDLGSALPSDGLVGAWIDQVQAATSFSGTGAVGSAATAAAVGATPGGGASLATLAGPAMTGAVAATIGGGTSVAAVVGTASASGVVAAKVAAAGLGIALVVGTVGVTTDPGPTTTSDEPGVTRSATSAIAVGANAAGTAGDETRSLDQAVEPSAVEVAATGIVVHGDAGPASDEDLTDESDDGPTPLSRDEPNRPVGEQVDDVLGDPDVPSLDVLGTIPTELHLSTAGALILDPGAETDRIVSELRDRIDLRDVPGTGLDASGTSLGDALDRVGSTDGLDPTEQRRSVEEVVREGTDRVVDTVESLGPVPPLGVPDAGGGDDRPAPTQESATPSAPEPTADGPDPGGSGTVLDDVTDGLDDVDVPIVGDLLDADDGVGLPGGPSSDDDGGLLGLG